MKREFRKIFQLRDWPKFGVLVLVLAVMLGLQRSQAEVEVPIVDTNDFLAVDVHGVYAYFRSDRVANNPSPGDPNNVTGYNPQEYYEVYAVGKNPDAVSPERGLLYFFNGTTWKRYPMQKKCNATTALTCQADAECNLAGGERCATMSNEPLNAVTGQYNSASGTAEIWAVGDNGRVMFNGGSFTEGDYPNSLTTSFVLGELDGNPICGDANNGPITTTNDLFAIDAPLDYHTGALLGGQNGALFEKKHYADYVKVCTSGANIGLTCTTDANCSGIVGSCKNTKDSWIRQCPASFPQANEHITGIVYAENRVRYVVTTQHAGTDLAQIRNCANVTGAPVGRLYRFDNTADTRGSMTLLGTAQTGCFYGLAVEPFLPTSTNNGRALNTIWIATSSGLRRFLETTPSGGAYVAGGALSGTAGLKFFSVASTSVTGGQGQNILRNGEFEAWSSASPNTSTPSPDGWLQVEGYGQNNGSSITNGLVTSGTCKANERDVVVSTVRPTGSTGAYSLKIEPGYSFTDTTRCPGNLLADRKNNYSAAVYRDVPLTNIEGARFRITGKYRVEFTNPTNPSPAYAEGGIGVTCPGGAIGDARSGTDCSFSYWGGIRTAAQGNTLGAPGADANGFMDFSVVISNQHSQYNERIKGPYGNPKVSRDGMVIQIFCEATYGARAWCDDIKIERLDEPGLIGFSRTLVTAVGADGIIYRNNNALSSNTFTREANPTAIAGQHLYGASYGQAGYLYAGGSGSVILQRSPSNLNGYLWAGASSPASSGRAGLGWISTSCVNSRDGRDRTLCQRQPVTYGLNFEGTSLASSTLSGRAWFGKNFRSGSVLDLDKEQLDLGRCLSPITTATTAGQPYKVTGTCNTATRTCAGNPNKACRRDFDCYGRCEGDVGFICLYNSDCQIGASGAPASNSVSGTELATAPSFRLQCDASGGSLSACVGGGWLSFDPADFNGTPPNVAPNDIQSDTPGERNYCVGGGACIDSVNCPSGQPCHLKGVGQFLTPGNTTSPADPNSATGRGWLSLRGTPSAPNPITVAGSPRLYACRSCVPNLATPDLNDQSCGFCQDNSRQSCTPTSPCYYYCDADPAKPTCKTDADCLVVSSGSTCRQIGRCSQDGALNCDDDVDCSSQNAGYCASGALCAPAAGNSCNQYGVDFDIQNQTFHGYGWSSDYGWIDFRFSRKGTTRYIQTRLGDIYSQKRIGDISTQPPPANTCNATYVVSATGTIQNFCSSLTTGVADYRSEQPLSPYIPFSSQKNLFENALGRFDLTGMETIARSSGGENFNKYESPIRSLQTLDVAGYKNLTNDSASGLNDLSLYTSLNQPLNNQVLVAGSPATPGQTFRINREVTINNGNSSSGLGYGMMLVNGNLRVDSNIRYGLGTQTSINDLRYLGSWIVVVRGDLIIDTNVTNLVGAYYVTGTVCTVPRNSFTGTGLGATECVDPSPIGTVPNRFPLTVRGLIMSKKFVFGRRFAGTSDNPRPSELIIFDGRLQSNPMPGTIDFVSSLPASVEAGP